MMNRIKLWSTKITEVLRSQGEVISEKTVGNYMQKWGLSSVY